MNRPRITGTGFMTIQHFYVGCDISKATIDFLDNSSGTHTRITNTAAEILRFLKPYQNRSVCFAFEATGAYGMELQTCLATAGIAPVQINPLHARRFAQSRGRLAKTDRIDAAQLAEMATRYALPATHVFCQDTEELKALIVRRDQLVQQRAGEKKRLQQSRMEAVRHSLGKAIAQLSEEISTFEVLIQQAIRANPDFAAKSQLLQTIPGIGPAIAPVLIAMLREAGQTNRRAIAALAGIAPYNRDSGAMQGHRSIAGGRHRIRRALYMAALTAARSKSKLGVKYLSLREAGKPPKVALVAIARKIATIINAILKTKKAYA